MQGVVPSQNNEYLNKTDSALCRVYTTDSAENFSEDVTHKRHSSTETVPLC